MTIHPEGCTRQCANRVNEMFQIGIAFRNIGMNGQHLFDLIRKTIIQCNADNPAKHLPCPTCKVAWEQAHTQSPSLITRHEAHILRYTTGETEEPADPNGPPAETADKDFPH